MKLLLTSSGNTNPSIQNALLELLSKPFENANLVFISTAANVEKGDKSWLAEDINNFQKLNFNKFDVIDIANVKKDLWQPLFNNANVLVFGGGNEEYLLDWVRKSGVEQALKDLIGKIVYLGISAGSMMMSRRISVSSLSILYYEKMKSLKSLEGLGYVDFEIRPHLNSEFFPKVRLEYLEKLAKETSNTFYAIDDDTAVKVLDNEISIISEGQWKKFN